MHIQFIEIQNFRKLKSIRVDLDKQTTIFVGANNSGKTSAMVALGHFLIDNSRFTTNDFTLSNWIEINKIGKTWESSPSAEQVISPNLSDWVSILPTMDVWLNVAPNEIHYIQHLMPTLKWRGGLLGVRLRLEPKNIGEFFKEFLITRKASLNTIAEAKKLKGDAAEYTLPLWPLDMGQFLERKLNSHFEVKAYTLDPAKLKLPSHGMANPQVLPVEREPISGNPFKGLIKINEIDAQRGFSDASSSNDSGDSYNTGGKRKLSEQLRSYYTRHIDPSEAPEPSDIDALQALHEAQTSFDRRLGTSFESALLEIKDLGYPGVTDLELILSTKIHPMDGLNHDSALQYKVRSHPDKEQSNHPCLPEQYNGLGYQNLISMVFRLMSFRDHWMQVGKSAKVVKTANDFIPPLHLVLVEEPEAHLHVQVQQVFIRKAYSILRSHKDLGTNKTLSTQLIVTTHSSHIAHECNFAALRYFKRRPAKKVSEVPTSTVINLSEVFGAETITQKFVTRYLRTTHCDLFFADAAILVEGPAERMLVPLFIRERFPKLNQSYISLLEINGSHSHTLRPLIEHLGLITLIITDIDSAKVVNSKLVATQPKRNSNYVTNNFTLRTWLPNEKTIDKLLDMKTPAKIMAMDEFSSVRVAYQTPISVQLTNGSPMEEALSNTFEDSLVFSNVEFFRNLKIKGLFKKFKTTILQKTTAAEIGEEIFKALKDGDKAEFALELLYQDFTTLKVPQYIREGLEWLEEQLKTKQLEVLIESELPIILTKEVI